MKEGLLKPPSLGMWLVLAIGVFGIAGAIIGPAFSFAVGTVVLTSFAIATGTVLRWLYRWLGNAAGVAAEEIAAGYRESRATGRMLVIPRDGEA